jgi:hypothetical protein
MTERTDGRGTITFGPGAYRPSTQWFAMSEDGSTCFDSISAVREVYDRIRVAQKADPGASQVDPAPSPSRSFPGARVPPEDVVSEQLGSGERLLWAGRPKQGFLLRVGDLIAIPFSIAWAGVCLLMMVSRGPDDPLPIVVVVPFAAIGIYMLVGRFVVDIWLRAHTTYGLTNRRVVIIVEGFRRQIKSLSLQTLADVALSESPDGSGTITFGSVPSPMWYPEVNVPGFAGPQMPRFERIANSRIVYGQIRAAQS